MTTQNEIFISVCLPTYNRASFLAKAIESVLNQQYDNFELIITDNNSSDDTLEVVKSYDNPKIKLVANKLNHGLWGNHNIAIEHASGKWVVFVHSDETLKNPNALQVFANRINNHRDKNLGIIISKTDRPAMADFIQQPYFTNYAEGPVNLLAAFVGIGNPSGMCYNVDALRECNGFKTEPDLFYTGDHYLLAQLGNAGYGFLYIDEPVLGYMPGEHQATASLKRCKIYNDSAYFFKLASQMPLFAKAMELYRSGMANWSFEGKKKMMLSVSSTANRALSASFIVRFILSNKRFLINRTTYYSLGNTVFGSRFYYGILKLLQR